MVEELNTQDIKCGEHFFNQLYMRHYNEALWLQNRLVFDLRLLDQPNAFIKQVNRDISAYTEHAKVDFKPTNDIRRLKGFIEGFCDYVVK